MSRQPHIHKRYERGLPFARGLALYLLFWVVVSVPVIGIVIAIGATPRPMLIGWPIAAAGIYGAIATVRHWAPILPAVFAPAILNSFIMLADGHVLNQPNVLISRFQCLAMIGVMIFGAITTAPFAQRNLLPSEKMGAIGIWICFVAAFVGVELDVKGWEVPVSSVLVALLASIQIVRSRAANRDFLGRRRGSQPRFTEP